LLFECTLNLGKELASCTVGFRASGKWNPRPWVARVITLIDHLLKDACRLGGSGKLKLEAVQGAVFPPEPFINSPDILLELAGRRSFWAAE
jgi:hypothetical protein